MLLPPQDLADRDEEMKAQYGEILQRFYNLFDSIYRYVQDFLQVRPSPAAASSSRGARSPTRPPSLASWLSVATLLCGTARVLGSSSRTSARVCSSSTRWSRCCSTRQASN